MLSYLVEAPGQARLTDLEPPVPGPRDVLVRVAAVGICGSDLEMVAGTRDPQYCRLPVVLGHEWSGYVDSVGAAAPPDLLGQLVAVEGHNYCHVCDACRRGATQRCAHYDEFGFTRHGGYAPWVAARADLCHVMTAATPEIAALTEPTACALHAIERVNVTEADTVVVLGAGPIGLLAAMLAAARQARRVVVCDTRSSVSQVARQLGATDVVTGSTEQIDTELTRLLPQGADVVIEAAGQAVTQRQSMRVLARGGRVALVGIAGAREATMNLDALVLRDARVEATFAYSSAVFARAAAMLDGGQVDPRPLVTHRFPLSQVDEAFALLRTRDTPVLKILLDPHA